MTIKIKIIILMLILENITKRGFRLFEKHVDIILIF